MFAVALFQCKLFSQSLYHSVDVTVVLPLPDGEDMLEGRTLRWPQKGREVFQVLYLLHGFGGDESDWLRYTNVERYALEKGVALVMPAACNSMYSDDWAGAMRYFSFYTQELPQQMERIFPLAAARENRFIAGFSMGGYGALKAALTFPERYAAAASLSGGLDPKGGNGNAAAFSGPAPRWRQSVFGRDMAAWKPERDDLTELLRYAVSSGAQLPQLYQCCGTGDFLYPTNCAFQKLAASLGANIYWDAKPGTHNFQFWDQAIQNVLAWLPLAGEPVVEK